MWYKLDGDNIIPAESMTDGGIAEARKRQNLTHLSIGDDVDIRVSTVFLGLDHGFHRISVNSLDPAPVLFETMVFLDEYKFKLEDDEFLNREEIQVRYTTIKGARKGHEKIVEHVKNELTKKSLGEVKIEHIRISL